MGPQPTQCSVSHLILAVRQEDADAIKRLCELDPTVAGRASDGTTALQVACSVGNADLVQLLINFGADKVINTASKRSRHTPISLAAAAGADDIVEHLIELGATANVVDAEGWAPLHHAALKGHAHVCTVLLDAGRAQPNATTHKQETPLSLAALRKHGDTCLVLLDRGAQVEFVTAEIDREFVNQLLDEDTGGKATANGHGSAHTRYSAQARKPSAQNGGRATSARQGQGAHGADEEEENYDDEVYEDDGEDAEGEGEGEASEPTSPQAPPVGLGVVTFPSGARRARPVYVSRNSRAANGAPWSASTRSNGGAYTTTTTSPAASPKVVGRPNGLPPVKGVPPLRSSPSSPSASGRIQGSRSRFDASPQASPKSRQQSALARNGTQASATPPAGWTLHAFSYKGLSEGLLLDKDTCLVYFLDPAAQRQRLKQQQEDLEASQDTHNAGSEAGGMKKAKAPLPVLVGKLVPGPGGIDAPTYGRITPLTANDAGTVELNKPALRCVRAAAAVAPLLLSAAKVRAGASDGDDSEEDAPPLSADLAPELGALPLATGVSLTVPLCAILGIRDVSELAALTEKDLLLCDVDTSFLPALLEFAEAHGGQRPGSGAPLRPTSTRPSTARASPALSRERSTASMSSEFERGRFTSARNSTGGAPGADGGPADSAPPTLPNLSQLLTQHGLLKLLPLAAERKLLTSVEVHRWDELGSAAAIVPMSRPELTRLKGLMAAIRGAQDTALMMQASRMELLMRLTVGSLVLYEADPLRASLRGERLAGVVLEDLGPGVGASGKQYKVRDLLDDSISWLTPGQVRRLSPTEALTHLRADLLPPPNSCGAPVTPLTAYPGLAVQLATWAWSPPGKDIGDGARSTASGVSGEGGVKGDGGPGGLATPKAMSQVVATLVEPASEDGLTWYARWPDGHVRPHAIGAGAKFELVHLQLHRLAGAPLAHAHFARLLCGQDMLCVPVTRSPLWPRATTDDAVPGSLGLGFVDAAQTALAVVWSRARDGEPSLYSPDGQGLYPLCHGLCAGSPVTALCAKEGLLVEPGAGGKLTLMSVAASGPGALLAPVRMGEGGQSVVWRVRWASGASTEHELGMELVEPELVIAEGLMVPPDTAHVALLNEVTKRGAALKGGAAGAAASSAPALAATALAKSEVTAAAAATAKSGLLGRPLFCKTPALASTTGMLGLLVKLNLGALALQPGCEQGPMASYEPRPLSVVLAAKKEGLDLGPAPRDDVGIVMRDLGPGVWRGLLVRKLGSTESYWYDESVLLPASPEDVARQVARKGPGYTMPRHLQGVPVTDASAAPGMLVQRAYGAGAVLEGSDKATMVGELLRPVAGGHAWEVLWPDGSTGIYKTGARNKFQLAYVNLHDCAGAPLLSSTVGLLAAAGAGRIAVTDGPHAVAAGLPPGAVRYVNDPDTQQGLLQQEVAQLAASGMVPTSAGERRFAGGLLRLYELSHALVPGEPLTIYTAKRGLRVALQERGAASATDGTDAGADSSAAGEDGDKPSPPRPPSKLGVLLGPTRLAVRAVLDAGSGAGSGQKGGPTASREPVLLLDTSRCFWEVEWDNGRREEMVVGTAAAHTGLRAAPSGAPAGAAAAEGGDAEEVEEGGEEDGEEKAPEAPKPVEVTEHFVRMVEPLMLLPSGDEQTDGELVSRAVPLQRAIGWNNQVMRELCRVWWSAARLAAAESEAAAAAREGGSGVPARRWKSLWRPNLDRVAMQPDQVSLFIKARPGRGGALRWRTLAVDPDGAVAARISPSLDEALAHAVSELARALTNPGSEEGETYPQLHLVLTEDGSQLAVNVLTDGSGRTVPAPPKVVVAAQEVNDALAAYRAALAAGNGEGEEEGGDGEVEEGGEVRLAFDIAFAIEPSMGVSHSDGSSRAKSVVVSMVQEVPPDLQRPLPTAGEERPVGGSHTGEEGDGDGAGAEQKPEGEEEEEEEGGEEGQKQVQEQQQVASVEEQEEEGTWYEVGPSALLGSGATHTLHGALLHTHRAFGALGTMGLAAQDGGAELSSDPDSFLQLVGSRQWCMWMDVPEHPMPLHLGAVRCLASVNVQLFSLRRLCARLNGAAGGGSAHIASPLVAVLHLIHAKARAAVAADAAQRRTKEAETLAAKARGQVDDMFETSSDVRPFDDAGAAKVLAVVRAALGDLRAAEGAAADAREFAAQATLPPALPVVEEVDTAGAAGAAEAAERAVARSAEAQHRAYPVAAQAVHRAALSVTAIMRAKLLESEAAYAAARAAVAFAQEARVAAAAADKAARNAEDEARAMHENELRKSADLDKAKSTIAANERALNDSEHALAEAQAALGQAENNSAYQEKQRELYPMPDQPEEGAMEDASVTAARERAREIHAAADLAANAARAALGNLESAQAAVQEGKDRLAKMRDHAQKVETELNNTHQMAADADGIFESKRKQAAEVTKAAERAQLKAEESARSSRMLDPGSRPSAQRGTQAEQAARAACAAEASLHMLRELQSSMPTSLRAPEAVARLLSRSASVVALVGAAAAAEWARTSTLPLESFLLSLEEAASAAEREAGSAAAAAQQASLGTTGGSSGKGGAGAGGGLNFVPPLPTLKDVTALLTCVEKDLLSALTLYRQLLPQVDAETTLTEKANPDLPPPPEVDEEGNEIPAPSKPQDFSAAMLADRGSGGNSSAPEATRTLSAAVLQAVLERAVSSAATTLERLANAANANVVAAVAEAAAAVDAAKAAAQTQAAGGPPNPAAVAQAVASAVAESLPAALRAGRIAALAAGAATLLPAPIDIPISDAKTAAAMTLSLRSTASAAAKAQQQVTALANDAASKLMKTSVGSAASPASVLCAAYSDLALAAISTDEAEYWSSEAAGAWPKARAAADAALIAIAPPPQAPAEEGVEEEEGEEEEKVSPAELAAKAAAVAEATRIISTYMANIAVKMAHAATDWAAKVMDPLTDLGLEEVAKKVALAAAALPPPSPTDHVPPPLGHGDMGAGQRGTADASPTSPAPITQEVVPPYPDPVVALIRALAAPLRLSDLASRNAGSHTGLDEVDESVKDVLAVAAESGKQHVNMIMRALEDIEAKAGEEGRPVSVEEGDIARGLVYCAAATAMAANGLVAMVPLVLPEEKVDNALDEASAAVKEIEAKAERLYNEAQAHAPRKAEAGAAAGGHGTGLTLALQVVLSRREDGSEGIGGRAQSPTTRRRRASASGAMGAGGTDPSVGAAAAFTPQVLDLDFVFAPPPGAAPLSEGEEKSKPSDAPAAGVLARPTIAALLQPFRTLMQAVNEAATAVAAALDAMPADRVLMDLCGLSPEAAAAAAASAAVMASGGRQAARTNMSQLQRWGPTVANMAAAVNLVVAGFQQAAHAVLEQCEPLVLPYNIVLPPPGAVEEGGAEEGGAGEGGEGMEHQ